MEGSAALFLATIPVDLIQLRATRRREAARQLKVR